MDPYFEDNQTEHVVDMTHFLSDAAIMKIFFAHPKINEADKNGYRLLIACQKKDWKEALRLLKEKEINPNFKDSYGRPLFSWPMKKRTSMLSKLYCKEMK